MGKRPAPAAVWTAGALYYTYYIGEVMRLFDVSDLIMEHWRRGQTEIADARTQEALARLFKKRDRRLSPPERVQLYKRVFHFGEVEIPPTMSRYDSFPSDWNRLMKGVSSFQEHKTQGADEMAMLALTLINQATRDMQHSISAVMAGTAYLMASEVYTLLRETIDLMKSEDLQRHYGLSGASAFALVARVAEVHFGTDVRAPVVSRIAESGSHILQDWVARFEESQFLDGRFNGLVHSAQNWTEAFTALGMD